CKYLFEGSCVRYSDEVQPYRHLDHGYCGIPGPTDPVIYEDSFIVSKVEIPRKCLRCAFLEFSRIRGFGCRKDAEIWGDFPRGLDWGTWEPDSIYLSLPLPKVATRAMSLHAKNDDLILFIKEHRRVNPGLSIEEAKDDFKHVRSILARFQKDSGQ